jgi:hypothetical protein
VTNCVFDGINKENRNAISVIDGDGITIENNSFKNCTYSSQPGAIDMEPDNVTYSIIKNISIKNNKFDNIGGNVAIISNYSPVANVGTVTNILVEGNTVSNSPTATFYNFNTNKNPTSTSLENDIKIIGNNISGIGQMFFIFNGKKILIERNIFTDITGVSSLISSNGGNSVVDMNIINNRFVRVNAGTCLSLFSVSYIKFLLNKFIDCGTGAAGSANAIDFNTGTSSHISFIENEFSSPTSKTLIAIQKESGHTFSKATNMFYRNTLNSLPSNFLSDESDTIEQSYSAVVTGSSSAGTGTYTLNTSIYKRIGTIVFFRIQLAVSAGHTGTGMIQVSLPIKVKPSSNNELRPISIALDGVSTTGGQLGMINPAVSAGGILGAIRCYYTGTGTLGQTLIPAGAFTVYASGSYECVV